MASRYPDMNWFLSKGVVMSDIDKIKQGLEKVVREFSSTQANDGDGNQPGITTETEGCR